MWTDVHVDGDCGDCVQVALWDVRQGERGGCVQRVNAYNGGWPLYGLAWVAGAVRDEAGGPATGLLAVTGAERSVVMLEPRKWVARGEVAGVGGGRVIDSKPRCGIGWVVRMDRKGNGTGCSVWYMVRVRDADTER